MLCLYYSFFAWQVIGNSSNKTPTPIQICIGLVDAVLRPKILGNRPGILTKMLVAMDFFIYVFQGSTFNLEIFFRKSFDSLDISNWIYLPWNWFQTISQRCTEPWKKLVLKILLICKFLNFTAIFTEKNQTFQSLQKVFHVRKLISV